MRMQIVLYTELTLICSGYSKSLEERLIIASEENEQLQQQLKIQKELSADMTRRHTARG